MRDGQREGWSRTLGSEADRAGAAQHLSLLSGRAAIRADITTNVGIILIRKAGLNLFISDCDGPSPPQHVCFCYTIYHVHKCLCLSFFHFKYTLLFSSQPAAPLHVDYQTSTAQSES